jgi:arsenite-transporting ATPase
VSAALPSARADTWPAFLNRAPRHLFFTGKGGVGKTSLACASAVLLAEIGRRVLIVSTDPASNLDAVLDTALANEPTPVPGVPTLWAMNIDPEEAARDYRERTVGPHRGVLPPDEIAALEERLSGACTVEVAAFDEFALLLGESERTEKFQHVIFDTAPTGHTLRLLELPAAWTGFLDRGTGDASCLGPLSGLKAQRERYAQTAAALADPGLTVMIVVARPERGALVEAARTTGELRAQGMRNQYLAINGVFRAVDSSDPLAAAFERRAASTLAAMPAQFVDMPRVEIALRPHNIVGLGALRGMFAPVDRAQISASTGTVEMPDGITDLAELVDALAQADHGLIMVMGKGGVGKTTVAAAIAVALAHRGKPVQLTTTDPAQHIGDTLQVAVPNLEVDFIDPKAEVMRYRERMLQSAKANRTAEQTELLREELQSPCYEELAVFLAFSRKVMSAHQRFVIIDTAPTGHTLLLLDTTGAYHRQMMEKTERSGARVRTPLMMLQDRDYTKVLIVALAETTPVLEAASLQEDLRRAAIEPFAWVINASLAAAKPTDPILRARAAAEIAQFENVRTRYAKRIACVPFQAEEPLGAQRLLDLCRSEV